jgi:twitching motility protein PilT
MKTLSAGKDVIKAIVAELRQSRLFCDLPESDLIEIAANAKMIQFDPGEMIRQQGEPSTSFAMVAAGEVSVRKSLNGGQDPIEMARIKPYSTLGEIELLLRTPHDENMAAVGETLLLCFDEACFSELFRKLPSFGLVVCRAFARRLRDLQSAMDHQGASSASLPVAGDTISPPPAPAGTPESDKLSLFLRRMVAERASDLHLSAHHRPRWRIDGEISEIPDSMTLGSETVFQLIEPIMSEHNRAQFQSDNDTDFAYAIPGIARFRINLFRDNRGVGAVFRQIPDRVVSIDQLGLPSITRQLCEYPKGMIVVTGPTGSGKSTTLAAMIDHLNKTRSSHIITLEDPIEFVHQSQRCLVNQREIGPHSTSFARALRAVLREDPDIVLVGEMRDLETVSLALETANTGHLVFGTLHTNTAVSTVARIIDMFPAEQQNQVRAVLADNLKGVVAQTLCRRIGGGRVAALEILVSDTGVASLIRENKTHQIFSAMQTGKQRGNKILNEELARLVKENIVASDEAMRKAVDKPDLASRLGIKFDLLVDA